MIAIDANHLTRLRRDKKLDAVYLVGVLAVGPLGPFKITLWQFLIVEHSQEVVDALQVFGHTLIDFADLGQPPLLVVGLVRGLLLGQPNPKTGPRSARGLDDRFSKHY